jgi:spore maturation protein SpmA
MNAFSHQHVFQLQKEQLVPIGFTNFDELLELKGKNDAPSGDRQPYVIVFAGGIENVFFYVFAYQETYGLKELTNILLDLFSISVKLEFAKLAIERKRDVCCEQVIHQA